MALTSRLVEPAGGAILIDGMEGAKMGLRDLRQGLAIIPQVRSRGATRGHTRTAAHACSLLSKHLGVPFLCSHPAFFCAFFLVCLFFSFILFFLVLLFLFSIP